jgi:hypothetical protein
MRVKQYAAAFTLAERAGGANLGAVRLSARVADRRHEPARQSAACFYVYAALAYRMILPVNPGADQHTRKAPDTFIHFIRF